MGNMGHEYRLRMVGWSSAGLCKRGRVGCHGIGGDRKEGTSTWESCVGCWQGMR